MIDRKYGLMLSLFSLAVWFLAGCGNGGDSSEGDSTATAGSGEETELIVPVQVRTVVADTFHVYAVATGTIRPIHSATVQSESFGRVTAVDFEVGRTVKKGQRLVQLDDELLRLARDQAEAALMMARANAEKTAKDLERNENIFRDGVITESQLEAARLQASTAEANHLSAQAALSSARRRLRDARITSPIDGQVSEKPVDVGQNVDPGNPVARVVDISEVKVQIGITQEQIPLVKPGQTALISIDAFPERKFEGKVLSVSPEASLETRTFQVEVLIPNDGPRRLLPGMTAEVSVEVDRVPEAVLVPTDAILERAGEYIVFVKDGSRAERRTINPGASQGSRTLVRDGLAPGDVLIVTGQENLADGTAVNLEPGN